MAKITRSQSSSLRISSSPPSQGGMTVWALRDFVQALDDEGVKGTTRVVCEHNHSTGHLTGLWIREDTAEELPAPSPGRTTEDG